MEDVFGHKKVKLDNEIVIAINIILETIFCQTALTQKEIILLDLYYPSLTLSPCDILQGVYFILEYRASLDKCISYEKLILDKLVENGGCTLSPIPPFKKSEERFLIDAYYV